MGSFHIDSSGFKWMQSAAPVAEVVGLRFFSGTPRRLTTSATAINSQSCDQGPNSVFRDAWCMFRLLTLDIGRRHDAEECGKAVRTVSSLENCSDPFSGSVKLVGLDGAKGVFYLRSIRGHCKTVSTWIKRQGALVSSCIDVNL